MFSLRYFVALCSALLLIGCASTAEQQVTIQASGMSFARSSVRVKMGQPVVLRVVNRDGYAHAFDMDDFDIHSPLAAKETLTFTFTPEKAGRYLFYCGSPGHKMAGMEGTLIVEP